MKRFGDFDPARAWRPTRASRGDVGDAWTASLLPSGRRSDRKRSIPQAIVTPSRASREGSAASASPSPSLRARGGLGHDQASPEAFRQDGFREGCRDLAFDERHCDDDAKVRRLPIVRGWTPLPVNDESDGGREQGYLKTIKAKSAGQERLIEAIDAYNLVMALGPAGSGKTYLAIAKAVEALDAGKVARIVLSRPAVEAGESLGFCQVNWKTSSRPICARSTTRSAIASA